MQIANEARYLQKTIFVTLNSLSRGLLRQLLESKNKYLLMRDNKLLSLIPR